MAMTARTLIVSSDAARRERWARAVAAIDPDPLRCAGPRVSCALLEDVACPLLEEARLAIYDAKDYLPALARRIAAGHGAALVVLAEDGPDGSPRRVRLAPRGAAGCFGAIPNGMLP